MPQGTRRIAIRYRTSPEAGALQWLTPEQAGSPSPFLYTQSQAILARTWAPCQDSPAVRMTYEATIRVPQGLMAVMSAENPTKKSPDGVYKFRMPQRIPAYLLALGVGDLEFRALGSNSGVYALPSMIEKAAWELADTPKMIDAAEKLYGPYRWGRYDLLVLPSSFPYGGMENPRLTFATPTVITGDKALVSLVAHELAHSWSGNLVTNATWNDFWLNEGFTNHLTYRIMEEVYGADRGAQERALGASDLRETLARLERDDDKTLMPDLTGRDPDDGERRAVEHDALPDEVAAHRLRVAPPQVALAAGGDHLAVAPHAVLHRRGPLPTDLSPGLQRDAGDPPRTLPHRRREAVGEVLARRDVLLVDHRLLPATKPPLHDAWFLERATREVGALAGEPPGALVAALAVVGLTGARFVGSNRNGRFRWSTVAEVTAAEPARRFAFTVLMGAANVLDRPTRLTTAFELVPRADAVKAVAMMLSSRMRAGCGRSAVPRASRTPKRSSNWWWTSTGSAAPPATATRRLAARVLTSTLSSRALSRPQYIVGTPPKKVTDSRSIRPSAAAGSKRGSITTVPPKANAPFWMTVWPKEWNSGSTHR